MRLLYLSADPGVPVLGRKGASVHLREMVRAFEAAGARVVVLSPRIAPEGERLPGTVELHEIEQSVDDLQVVINTHRFLPRPPNPAVPELRGLLGAVRALEPRLTHDQYVIRMSLRPADGATEMVLEMV